MVNCQNISTATGDEEDLIENEIRAERLCCIGEETYQTGLDKTICGDDTMRNGNTDVKQECSKQCESSVHDEASGEEFLETLLEGVSVPLDTEVPMNSFPPWMDKELLRKGREFGLKYLFGLVYSQMLSLVILFSFRGGLEPLIFTGKSGTPYSAFRRYLSTVTRIASWYESDVFEKDSAAQNNMVAVRAMHASVFKRMNEASAQDLKAKVTMKGTGIWCTYLEELKKDLRGLRTEESSCPFAEISSLERKDGHESGAVIYVNQLDLSLTQFGFVALNILYPQKFGVHGATEDELRGYVHLWRCLGYLLGIKDRYNICSSGDLEVTRERCRAVIQKWAKPGFGDVTSDWEHMFRCVVEGISYYVPGNTFGGAMAYLLWVLGVPFPNLLSKMTWLEKIMFYTHRLVLNYMLRIPGYLKFCNFLLNRSLRKARNASAEWLRRKRDRVYDFQKIAAPSTEAVP